MTRRIILFLAVSCFFWVASSFAQYGEGTQGQAQNEDVEIPPGMEAKKVNSDVTVLMPKGAVMHQRNASTFVLESAEEYSARKFVEVEARLAKLEEENKQFKEDIDRLESRIKEIKRSSDATTRPK